MTGYEVAPPPKTRASDKSRAESEILQPALEPAILHPCKIVRLLRLDARQLRSDDLPTSLPICIGVGIAHLHCPRLTIAFRRLH